MGDLPTSLLLIRVNLHPEALSLFLSQTQGPEFECSTSRVCLIAFQAPALMEFFRKIESAKSTRGWMWMHLFLRENEIQPSGLGCWFQRGKGQLDLQKLDMLTKGLENSAVFPSLLGRSSWEVSSSKPFMPSHLTVPQQVGWRKEAVSFPRTAMLAVTLASKSPSSGWSYLCLVTGWQGRVAFLSLFLKEICPDKCQSNCDNDIMEAIRDWHDF